MNARSAEERYQSRCLLLPKSAEDFVQKDARVEIPLSRSLSSTLGIPVLELRRRIQKGGVRIDEH